TSCREKHRLFPHRWSALALLGSAISLHLYLCMISSENRRPLFRIMQGDPKGPRRGSQADGAAWQLSGFCEHDLADVDIPRQESGLAIGEVVLPQSPESIVEPRWHQVGPSLAEIASPDRERLGIIFPEYVLANDGHAKALAELF